MASVPSSLVSIMSRLSCVVFVLVVVTIKSASALSLHNLNVVLPTTPSTLSCSSSVAEECHNTPGRLSRRAFVVALSGAALSSPTLVSAKDLKEEYRQGTAALAESDAMAPVPREAYKKLDSGVVYADLRSGSGEAAKPGSRINLQWVLRKSNGYFVDSSEVNDSVPFIFTVGDGTAIAGLNEAVQGMRPGGVRRILIPPSLAYVDGLEDGKPGPLPTGFGPRQQMRRVQNVRKDVPGEYVYLEVQMTRLRQ